ncbi:hypothetical protein A3F03_02830 [Candidatus Roizmanbacteria bacterium RIFCSPHIGHO2_12_FULL_41_11]|uniref:Uncharacterized protein n=3 Tax=Candidatus Roizmaniibacteriota TaxID=1752723 RepID=A0A1F7JQK3_9BACT|nr:MAG: hypothetical protein A3F03_02830 [Candidatus Roizmanbacteria bacterium RIFCSPHIGHO2_12_FULL_41_11]OGK51841.1 MAG: hypothetical protein A2966_00480 [Candidatus Roizmanbacteria bacterium RIFCSPLOWO2_01_FULL_41_22]OGK57889.1 MAG: hypothetical protein A3H86_01085 [Candidatus Roizmanbacteria bacterium RIFCSPLOWO2_02_FULL_41_9]
MPAYPSILQDKSLLIIFAYAPAGLGHLRVTDALYHGLPQHCHPILLGSQDKGITLIHRFTSIHPLARAIFEWSQHGIQEKIFTFLYRAILWHTTDNIYRQMKTVLTERMEPAKTVLIVATHFGLAHQLAAIKDKLIEEFQVKIFIIVQVTDDSPQYMWFVPNTDLTLVPSEETKKILNLYGKRGHFRNVRIEVNPYPVSPGLGERLLKKNYDNRLDQLDRQKKSRIFISLPVSGAAVGTKFLQNLMLRLNNLSDRYFFYLIAKEVPFTSKFLRAVDKYGFIHTHTHSGDRLVVNAYEMLYQQKVIALEITKPSEQAFKTLFEPTQKGGSIMLFSHPVGRQEYDNLAFLRRHRLIPTIDEQNQLWSMALNYRTGEQVKKLVESATHWRGLILPDNPQMAAEFTDWALQIGLLAAMGRFRLNKNSGKFFQHQDDLTSYGVELFWKKVIGLLKESAYYRE